MSDYFAGDPRDHYERMLAGDLYIADDPRMHETVGNPARVIR